MPQDLYWNFRETVTDVRRGLGDFETSWNGSQTQEVLDHAKQSRDAKMGLRNGHGGEGSGDAEPGHDWAEESPDRKQEERRKMMMENGVDKNEQGVVVERAEGEGIVESQAQINDAVGRLRKLHPDFNKIDLEEENKSIKVSVEDLKQLIWLLWLNH